ncbi:MAG: hypothetical protein OQK51_25795 [Kangiellaceae bacterium]|nr:hypothetical protein [Kangiellaceae bacterium]
MFKRALKLAYLPIIIALIVTPLRFSLELAGIPEIYIFFIGLLWLTLAFSIYWGFKLVREKKPYQLLLYTLLIFSPISRLPVFVLWWITKTWNLGTHYDIFDNWSQALIGQLFYGALVQIIPGFIVAALLLSINRHRIQVNEPK